MRITLLQGAFLPVPPLRGGAIEKMWFRLGQEFAARGHEVTHVSRRCDGLPAREEIAGVRHLRVAGFDRPRTQTVNQLRDFCYSLRALRHLPDADVIVTNTFWSPFLLSRRHGAVYVDVQRMPRGQMRFYRRAARLRANSSAVAAAIAAEAPQVTDRVRVIPNPLAHVPEAPPAWATKTRTVLFVGRLHAEKGLELLLQAWTRWQGTAPAGWTLRLVGPSRISEGGGGEAWVDDLRRRYPSRSIVWSPPIFDERELYSVFEAATVFVYPSLAERGETFGSAVLEAMSAGCAPIVSNLACFRDFVVSGRNGLVFDHRAADPAAALAKALEQATGELAHALGEQASAVRQSHAPGLIADRFIADFATLV